jgi:hypothetical protein
MNPAGHGARRGKDLEDRMGRTSRQHEEQKENYWRGVIQEAKGSSRSVRAFCQHQGIKESQFYWWQRRLKGTAASPKAEVAKAGWKASFALVSDQPREVSSIGIELLLAGGRRLRIGRGVDETTLRTVLAVLESERC